MIPTIDISNIIKAVLKSVLSVLSSPLGAVIALAGVIVQAVGWATEYLSSAMPNWVGELPDLSLFFGGEWHSGIRGFLLYICAVDVVSELWRYFGLIISGFFSTLFKYVVSFLVAYWAYCAYCAVRRSVKDIAG